jgi:hypothetical protein
VASFWLLMSIDRVGSSFLVDLGNFYHLSRMACRRRYEAKRREPRV